MLTPHPLPSECHKKKNLKATSSFIVKNQNTTKAISDYQFQSPLYFILSQVVILKPNSLEIWTEFNMHQSCNLVRSTEIVTIVITITKPTFSRLYCSPTGNFSLNNIIYLLSIVKACGKHCDTSANNFISFQILFRKCVVADNR